MAEQDCGCRIERYAPGIDAARDASSRVGESVETVAYCPMHKAAPEMLKALVHCEGAMDRLNGDIGTAKRPCQFCLADQYDGAVGIIHDAEDCDILEARKALAQARGQEVGA